MSNKGNNQRVEPGSQDSDMEYSSDVDLIQEVSQPSTSRARSDVSPQASVGSSKQQKVATKGKSPKKRKMDEPEETDLMTPIVLDFPDTQDKKINMKELIVYGSDDSSGELKIFINIPLLCLEQGMH
jgi:hypothetical protein